MTSFRAASTLALAARVARERQRDLPRARLAAAEVEGGHEERAACLVMGVSPAEAMDAGLPVSVGHLLAALERQGAEKPAERLERIRRDRRACAVEVAWLEAAGEDVSKTARERIDRELRALRGS